MLVKDWIYRNKGVFKESELKFVFKSILPSFSSLLLSQNETIGSEELKKLSFVREEYLKGHPLSYILQREEFFGHELFINSDVLIPRKETELLVEEAIFLIRDYNLRNVLDLCTGSANIAISIKKSLGSSVDIISSDIDLKALKVALFNCRKHDVNISLVNSDLFASFKKGYFDLIITNPPYVETDNIKGSLQHEPRIALEGGRNGLDLLKRIIPEGREYLREGGFLISEIGYAHKDICEEIISVIKGYEIVKWIKDYSGHFRGVIIKNG